MPNCDTSWKLCDYTGSVEYGVEAIYSICQWGSVGDGWV